MRNDIHFFLYFSLPLLLCAQNAPQPCPENPIVLTGSDFPQYVYSPYDELKHYPPNTDCRFILVARNLQRRIHITILESQLEEPLFTDCKDYVSVHDGGLASSQEIIRWCGAFYPPSLTSSGDSLYIHFHSDNIIQSRGFNLSFVDYDLPGCPPGWISDIDSVYCYKLFDSAQGFTFMDAQKSCYYERANLLTIENSMEYTFIVNQYSISHSFPWIGYNDANREGVFDPIDPNVPMWPETFQAAKLEHEDRDCVFLDWNIKDGTAHSLDDCRSRHSFICKKRQDGTTVPIQLSSNLIRYGFQRSSFNYTIIIIILLLLLILLIILWVIYQKCKKQNTISTLERGQRVAPTADSTVPPRPKITEPTPSPSTREPKTPSTRATTAATTKNSKSKTASTDAVKRIIANSAARTTGATKDALSKTINETHLFTQEQPDSERQSLGDNQTAAEAHQKPDSPRLSMSPNQPAEGSHQLEESLLQQHRANEEGAVLSSSEDERPEIRNAQKLTQLNVNKANEQSFESDDGELPTPRVDDRSHDRSRLYMETQPTRVVPRSEAVPKQTKSSGSSSRSTPLNSALPPVGEPGASAGIHREFTNVTAISSSRSRGTHPPQPTFERPHVGTLDNISAISLDEFWQNNK